MTPGTSEMAAIFGNLGLDMGHGLKRIVIGSGSTTCPDRAPGRELEQTPEKDQERNRGHQGDVGHHDDGHGKVEDPDSTRMAHRPFGAIMILPT